MKFLEETKLLMESARILEGLNKNPIHVIFKMAI
jgi:hypothetical protein